MKKLFYFLMALPFVACSEKESTPVTPEVKEPVLTLTSNATLEFEAEGGVGEITYTLENAVEGTSIEATCEAQWVEDLTAGQSVTFAVANNETEESRETMVKVAYGDKSFEVVVKQSGVENGGNDNPIDEPKDEFVEGWAINGTMNNWEKKNATAMSEEGNYFVVKGFVLTAEDNFNFILNGNEKNYGGNGQSAEPNYVYEAKSWGSNISVTEAGTYDIYLSTNLKNYYIMSEGVSPEEAEEPLKPGEKRWSIKGNIKDYDDVEIALPKDSKYCVKKNVEFVGVVAEFFIYCNSETTYGVASGSECVIEEATTIVEGGEAIKIAVTEGAMYDIYYLYKENGVSKLWVLPAGQYPVVWELVSGGYMPYGNFLCYFVSEDVELTVDFTAGVPVQNYVMPEGTYYVQDTENTGFCFDLQYCQVKVRGFKTMLMDGYMTVKHENGLYDIFIDMRTPQLDIIKMHWVGEFAFDSYFQMMGGRQINNPEK